MDVSEPVALSRRTLAITTALATALFGAAIVYGALEHGIGWSERGPETGFFPFRLGVLILLASAVNLIQAIIAHRQSDPAALTHEQVRRVAAFVFPMIGFVIATSLLGFYVAMILYLFGVMIVQGRYGVMLSTAVSLGTAVVFYLMFDKWLLVPLKKGPIEAWLGIY